MLQNILLSTFKTNFGGEESVSTMYPLFISPKMGASFLGNKLGSFDKTAIL